jgi:molecular chaperone IbpA
MVKTKGKDRATPHGKPEEARLGCPRQERQPKIFPFPLETKSGFSNFFVATRKVASGRLQGPAETGTGCVPVLPLVPNCSMENLAMRTYDLSPLWRSTIGFDRLFDLAEAAHRAGESNYPPYNIERLADDRYQISLAVAGFARDEIAVTAEQNVVTIEGNKPEKGEREFLYRGISTRSFKRQFNLADYVQVRNAAFDNGLLKIELVREIPEAMKPRRIAITGAPIGNVQQLEAKAA